MGQAQVELPVIKETPSDYDEIERQIREAFKSEIYLPLVRALSLSERALTNEKKNPLVDAIESGRIVFNQGQFKGRFSAAISKELRRIGAKASRTQGTWKVRLSVLPDEVQSAIRLSEARFVSKVGVIDKILQSILSSAVAEKVQVQGLFDFALFKVEKKLAKSIPVIEPKFTAFARNKMSEEYQRDTERSIKDFTRKETERLRLKMQKHILKGGRHEDLVGSIKRSFGVAECKAKFLARQETGLLMAKFKETRYLEAGIDDYKWRCVAGSPLHPVRPMHKRLDGTMQKFSKPPVTDLKGNRNNPGEDYNCRCTALAVAKFAGK